MLRLSSIAVSLLLILAGMNVTIASHYCHGALSKTIVSLTGKNASCGMEHSKQAATETTISSRCCDDVLTEYKVSDDYAPSDIRYSQYFQYFDYFLPEIKLPVPLPTSFLNHIFKSPPGNFSVSAVHPEDICVFRI